MPQPRPVIDVCAAVIVNGGRMLLAQRERGSHLAGKWEFPGGKIDGGETPGECIIREIDEELGLIVRNPVPLTTVEHAYDEKIVRLHFLACDLTGPADHEARVHEEVRWVEYDDLEQLDLAPADRRFVHWLGRNWQEAARVLPDASA